MKWWLQEDLEAINWSPRYLIVTLSAKDVVVLLGLVIARNVLNSVEISEKLLKSQFPAQNLSQFRSYSWRPNSQFRIIFLIKKA